MVDKDIAAIMFPITPLTTFPKAFCKAYSLKVFLVWLKALFKMLTYY